MFHMHWMSCLALADFIIIFGLKLFSICPLIFKTRCVKTEGNTGGRLAESFCFINVTNDPNWLSTSCLTFDLRRALGQNYVCSVFHAEQTKPETGDGEGA